MLAVRVQTGIEVFGLWVRLSSWWGMFSGCGWLDLIDLGNVQALRVVCGRGYSIDWWVTFGRNGCERVAKAIVMGLGYNSAGYGLLKTIVYVLCGWLERYCVSGPVNTLALLDEFSCVLFDFRFVGDVAVLKDSRCCFLDAGGLNAWFCYVCKVGWWI
eukprot:gene13152-8998_t